MPLGNLTGILNVILINCETTEASATKELVPLGH